jgi:hypothetical protein
MCGKSRINRGRKIESCVQDACELDFVFVKIAALLFIVEVMF